MVNQLDSPALLRLIRALHAVDERLEEALEPLGLSLAKLGALSKLAEAGQPMPLGSLAERLACVRSNITQLVDRLEADKMVERLYDARDRRSVKAALTDEGRSRQAAGTAALKEVERRLFANLTDEQKGRLLELLEVLTAGR